MGAFEDYIDKIGSESGSMGPWLAHWRLCTLQSDYYHKYGRYPSKNELFEYGNSLMEGNSCTHSKASVPVNSTSSSTSKNNTSQPSEEALKILKSSELNKENLLMIQFLMYHLIKRIKYGNRCNNRKG